MRLGALLGWGIVIYAVTALASTGMDIYGFLQGIWPHVVELVVLFVVCLAAGSALKFRKRVDILPYSIGWALVYLALNAVFLVPFFGWQLYSSWMLWADCALIVLFPLCATSLGRRKILRGVWET